MALTKSQQNAVGRAKNQLQEQQLNGDTESAHGAADEILCQLLRDFGLNEIVEEWEKINKWYA